ncbi:hypothetical protein [Bacillus sp. FJAT-45350]|uniref:hypothetical protein n=1 Tax=Bacillus sp. FJAT-45350 TaxID=2011014 RepID=UPI000BB904F3|nr:hypothetical protein [Bacillus sp. FJAT-45350]
MFRQFIELPWVEKFLPDKHKPVDERLLSDEISSELIFSGEQLIDSVINKSDGQNKNRTITKKNDKRFKITLKISKKRIKIILMDTGASTAPIKKRIQIECFRKYFKSTNGIGKCKEASINYIDSKKTFVRSVRKSSHLQSIFYKIDMLDDALMGQLINDTSSTQVKTLKTGSEEGQLILELKRITNHKSTLGLDPLLENKVSRILKESEKLFPDFSLLDIEERHIVRRMLREDIPNLIHTYLSLSPKNQLLQKEQIFITLSKMELTIISYVERMEKAQIQHLEHLVKLNNLRYPTEK